MCDKCDFCGNPGMDRCIVCHRCYCIDHMGVMVTAWTVTLEPAC
jgi:hypothetical protein